MQQRELIIALDFSSKEDVNVFLSRFQHEKLFLKVGMELYYKEGPSLVSMLKEQGHRLFLDLKLHDIPTTVNRAMKQLAGLEVDLVNVHSLGGKQMMAAAKEGLESGTAAGRTPPFCIAVTQLTSTSDDMLVNELGIPSSIAYHVQHLCRQTDEAGLDGVVCSALDVPSIMSRFPNFLTVTPGIRRESDAVDDQVRVVTPEKARELGSTAIVVGRGITRAADPMAAYTNYKEDWRA
jgi:orotidine-5'-phosphate decarboxylase